MNYNPYTTFAPFTSTNHISSKISRVSLNKSNIFYIYSWGDFFRCGRIAWLYLDRGCKLHLYHTSFNTIEEAKVALDEAMIESGFTLLNYKQYQIYMLLR